MRWTRAVRLTSVLQRTAKSCRSDAPMLVSSLREEAQATVSNKPGHREEHEVSRKTIARGMPGDFRCDRGDYARVFVFYHTRGCGCIERPAFPAPSDLQKAGRSWQTSGGSRREIAKLCLRMNAPHTQSSSPAKAGDPVFRGASDRAEKLRRTGYPACAGYDDLLSIESRALDVATGTNSRSIIRRPCESRDP